MFDMPTIPWDPCDRALYRLQVVFPSVSDRITAEIFSSYLDCETSLERAVSATRDRITDACQAA